MVRPGDRIIGPHGARVRRWTGIKRLPQLRWRFSLRRFESDDGQRAVDRVSDEADLPAGLHLGRARPVP